MEFFRHPTAIVESKAIGKGTKIWQYTVILSNAVIGTDCNINCHCFIENDVIISNNVTIKSGVYLWDGIRVEDNVFIGPNVTFANDLRPRSKQYPETFMKTTLKKGVSIGAGAVIVGGIVLGEYSMIGAGAVVTKSIPNNTIWYGNPARFKACVCNCGNKLNENFECVKCKKVYQIIKDKVCEA